MALTNVFQSFNLFLVFVFSLFPAVIVNVAPFSAYKTHTTHNSLHYVKFACTIFYRQKIRLFPAHCFNLHILWININHMHSLNMNHLYFLHFPTIFNQFQNSIFYFSWKLLCLFKLISHSLPQQSGKSFCCHAMFQAEVNGWWLTTSELGNQFLQSTETNPP